MCPSPQTTRQLAERVEIRGDVQARRRRMPGVTSAEVALGGGGSTRVHRLGDVVLRERRPWSQTVMQLLAHVKERGFTEAPAPVGAGFAPDGREQLSFIPGDAAPTCWTEPAIFEVGQLLRRLHDATTDFPRDRVWMPWWGRRLASTDVVIGHCDAAPWNFLAKDAQPLALLDWDSAGPVGREWDVAQTAWLNAQLHDDDVAERQQLPDAGARSRLLAHFCDGYRLSRPGRERLVENMIEVALRTAAQEAIDGGVTPTGSAPVAVGLLGGGPGFDGHELLWAVTWRTRSARWIADNRQLLQRAVSG
jgi:hypothetical protein